MVDNFVSGGLRCRYLTVHKLEEGVKSRGNNRDRVVDRHPPASHQPRKEFAVGMDKDRANATLAVAPHLLTAQGQLTGVRAYTRDRDNHRHKGNGEARIANALVGAVLRQNYRNLWMNWMNMYLMCLWLAVVWAMLMCNYDVYCFYC